RQWKLIISDQKGAVEKTVTLGDADYLLDIWSSDGKQIIYHDNHLNVFVFDVASGESTLLYKDNARGGISGGGISVGFSPDSKWISYTKTGTNLFSNIYLYNADDKSHSRITDGMSHAVSPVFSPDGKYLYFRASTNTGPSHVGLDLSSQERPQRFGLYAAVLAADGKSPLLPKSDEEKVTAKKSDGEKTGEKADSENEETKDSKETDKKEAEDTKTVIDIAGLADRIIALPIAEKNYQSLAVAQDGALFFAQVQQPGGSIEPRPRPNTAKLVRFDFKTAKASTAMDGIQGFSLSADGKKIIVQTPGNKLLVGNAAKSIDAKPVKTAGVKSFITPREEWAQIFDDVWRMEKQYFYAENMHGLDWDAVYTKYQPLVAHVATRRELNRVLVEMIGELQVGHNRVGGGDMYTDKPVAIGLLGADLRVENGTYRIKRVYSGEKWNPFLKAPLAIPGIGAGAGDYIHAINGTPLTSTDNIYARFVGTVSNQVTLSVSSDGKAENAKDVVVEPIRSERRLRHWAWVEGNRKHVDEVSGGKVGYIYLPDTAGGGFTYFNRMFFAQADKKALVIDERRNGGGQAANYITDVLSRQYLASWKDRDGMLFHTPGGAVYGPKAMLIDQDAGSGGDFLPYAFKHMGLGKLIGKTTWGGLIGISANPRLIDGGFLTVPYFRTFSTEGEWFIENEGVSPDIDVDLDPAKVNMGIDTQLDRAISQVLTELETYTPVQASKAPALPTEPGK
ncbi:MAG: PDZ domain-containing protein, partial [Kordiimonadaceae bacterium]|nr:PDZ domain-containing protein [Kordiimonadaceae bacterium]